MIPVCEWAPSQNVYTGSAETAIRAFTEIPLPVRKALIERSKKANSYDDVVKISRNSIAGKANYAPDITSMHFGSKGRMCKTVTRIKWRDSDSQSGMVFCEKGYCIIRPAVCNNWAIVYRTPEPPRALPPETPTESVDTKAASVPLLALPVGSDEIPPTAFEVGAGSAPFEAREWPIGSISGPVTVFQGPTLPTVPAIPEPAPLWLLLAGVLAIALWRKSR